MRVLISTWAAMTLLATAAMAAQPALQMDLWPGTAPGEKGDIGPEQLQPPKANEQPPVERLTNVTRPTISLYRPDPATNLSQNQRSRPGRPGDVEAATGSGTGSKTNGTAVVICPGGGYNILAFNKEGTEVAEWLNSIGVAGVVVKYRVPRRADLPKHQAPLQDAQRAVSLVRTHAKEWGINPDRIGVLGFSAGGHLAAATATNFDQRSYTPVDAADQASCRPDFAVLVYPAYLLEGEKQQGPGLAPEIHPCDKTPPVFFAHASDDRHVAENSIALYMALHKLKVPVELHVYGSGGHGFGLRPSDHPSSTWPQQCQRWMQSRGLLDKP